MVNIYIFTTRPASVFRGHIEDFQQGNLKFRLVIAASGDRSMMEVAIGFRTKQKPKIEQETLYLIFNLG